MTPRDALDRAKRYSQVDTAMLMLSVDHVARQLRALAPTTMLDSRLHALDAGLGRFGLPGDAAAEALVEQHAITLAATGSVAKRKGGAA